MTIKKSLLAAGILTALSGPAYAGSEIETLINMLHENGMVNDDQYGRLMAELKQNQAQAQQEKQHNPPQRHPRRGGKPRQPPRRHQQSHHAPARKQRKFRRH